MSRRRGLTLIEVMLTVAVGALVLGVGAGLIRTLVRLDRADRDRLAADVRLDRLAHAFRSDVRAATGINPAGGNAPRDRLELTLPGNRAVAYRVRAGGVTRTRRDGDEGRREERYKLPPGSLARLEIQAEGGRTVAVLTLDRTEGRGGSRGLRVEAVLSQDHRFEHPEVKSDEHP